MGSGKVKIMTHPRLSRSLRKYIRRKKASIRRDTADNDERDRMIQELYARFPTRPQAVSKKSQNGDL